MPSILNFRSKLARDTEFQNVVEAGVMQVAAAVLNEPATTPNHDNRVAVARSLFVGSSDDVKRFVRLFAWRAAFDDQIGGAVLNVTTGVITVANLPDTQLVASINNFWNQAAGSFGNQES